MITPARITAVIPTTQLEAAREFYERAIGLNPVPSALTSGHALYEGFEGARILLYERSYPPEGDHTLVTFEVSNLDEAMEELRGRGIVFEEIDLPGLHTDHGVAMIGASRGSWFRDPDGNLLGLGEYF